MTVEPEQMIGQRFAALVNHVDDSNWADVRRRARTRRPRVLLAIGVALLAVAIAAPALGLSGRLVHLFQGSEPAPQPVKEDFATLDAGAPKGMATGVIAEQTRKVIDLAVGEGARAVLYVAPTRSGGFCTTVAVGKIGGQDPGGGGGGCDRDRALPFSVGSFAPGPISPEGDVLQGPVLYEGSVLMHDGRAVQIDFQDGDKETIPVVWVTDPIDAAFFVYAVPESNWPDGHRPVTASLEDSSGTVLATRRLDWLPAISAKR